LISDVTKMTLHCVLRGCTAGTDCQLLRQFLNTRQHAESSLDELNL